MFASPSTGEGGEAGRGVMGPANFEPIAATRQLAKRQLTGCAAKPTRPWFDPATQRTQLDAAVVRVPRRDAWAGPCKIGPSPPRERGSSDARAGNDRTGTTKTKLGKANVQGQSLQDPFLNALRRERVPVSIYLVNGIKLQGTVESFDQFVVLLRNTVSQMVYKHAISTVVPARNIRRRPADLRGGRLLSGRARTRAWRRGRDKRDVRGGLRRANRPRISTRCRRNLFRTLRRRRTPALLIQPHAGGPSDGAWSRIRRPRARPVSAVAASCCAASTAEPGHPDRQRQAGRGRRWPATRPAPTWCWSTTS